MKLGIVVAALVVSGLSSCVTGSLTSAQSTCSSKASYSDMWGCTRQLVAKQPTSPRGGDLVMHYLAYGDALNEKYKAGRISNADAKLALTNELTNVNTQYSQRQAAMGGGGATTCQAAGPYTVMCY